MSGLRHASSAAWRSLRSGGVREVARRAAGTAFDRLGGDRGVLWLHPEDIADSRLLSPRPTPRERGAGPLRIGWVMTPPAPGSGGHTTVFRMVAAAERAGHHCTLFLYDRWGGRLERHEAGVRSGWPDVRAEVRDARNGVHGVDLAVATSWESAHVLARRGTDVPRCAYFIQDYEPYFYPRSWQYALAEDSYRFGFRCISLGPMVARTLQDEVGVDSDVVTFGLDTSTYRLTGDGPREGVVFFARPDTPRRGYLLGKLTVEELHRRRPEVPIHVFGSDAPDLRADVVRHGKMRPAELNELYNRCTAGIVPSFTNVSLVPEEMVAAGLVPVCNESALAREVLDNPYVEWTSATPQAMADRLESVLDRLDVAAHARAAAASVTSGRSWATAQEQTVRLLEATAQLV